MTNWKSDPLKGWRKGLVAVGLTLITPFSAIAQDRDEVTLGALRFVSHAAGFVAFERGYFEDENIDLSFEFFQAAQPIAVATASGDVDFGVTGVTGGLMNLAERNALRIVGGVLHERAGYDGMVILASNAAHEAGLTSIEDMPGHSVSMTQIGSTFHYMTSRIADANGWTMDDFDMVPLQSVGNMVAAIRSGQTDLMIMVPHVARALVNGGAAQEIGRLNDYVEYQISTMITSVDNIENDRDMVERFVRAYSRGIDDIHAALLDPDADPEETEAVTRIIHNYVYTDRAYEDAAPTIQAGAMYLNRNAALNRTDVAAQMAWFVSEGLVDSDLTVDQLVDSSFVETY